MEKLLLELCHLPGVSGDEKEVHDRLKEQYSQYTDTLLKDKLGSVFAKLSGQSDNYRVMISANMDESGGIIQDILPDGRLSFIVVGTYAKQIFHNQCVTVITRRHERIKGIVISEKDDCIIDVGANSVEHVKQMGITIGDMLVLDTLSFVQNGKVYSKNLKNRASLALGIKLLETLSETKVPFDTFIGGITHSVTGQRGAITATHVVKPHIALVIDAAYISKAHVNSVYVRAFDKTMLPNKQLLEIFTKIGTENGIKVLPHVQLEGTDGSFIHKSLTGAPTLVVTIPLEHENALLNSVRLDSLQQTLQALYYFVTHLTETDIQQCAFEEV